MARASETTNSKLLAFLGLKTSTTRSSVGRAGDESDDPPWNWDEGLTRSVSDSL
jgi:hypothetical protein